MSVFTLRTVHPITAMVATLMLDDENVLPVSVGVLAALRVGWSVDAVTHWLDMERSLVESIVMNGTKYVPAQLGLSQEFIDAAILTLGNRCMCHDRMFMISLDG